MSNIPSKPDDDKQPVMVQVAHPMPGLQAEIVAGVLRSAEIPVFVDLGANLPSTIFGQSGMARIYVPEAYFDMAMDILEEDDPLNALDEPPIKL